MSGITKKVIAAWTGLVAGALAMAVVVAGVVGAGIGRMAEVGDTRSAQDMLRAEVDAMVDAGLAPDDPKVRMLEDEVAALEALDEVAPVPEAGIRLDEVARGGTRGGGPDPTEEWEEGPVDCEPLPGLVTVDEITGADCRVEPLSGGGVRYVVVAPDGTERSLPFGRDR